MFKADVIAQLAAIPDDEPLLLLRAQDVLAPPTVRQWAAKGMLDYGLSGTKADSALKIAKAMETWQLANNDRVKVPD